jgi:putative GTP pyrophosphokinase
MSFPAIPELSKTKIDKAAEKLSLRKKGNKPVSIDDLDESLDAVNAWRVAHSYPLNTFNTNLRKKVRKYNSAIVAQRLKRMPTILDKLNREPNMQLTQMQDIAGIRAVVPRPKDVYEVIKKYKTSKKQQHVLKNEKDYIQTPRAKDGYRSYHLVYAYKSSTKEASQYDGLKIEVQVRTRLQHSWATAVETMGAILGQQLKSRKGEKEWLDFFAITSSAFAHIEGTPLVPGYEHLNRQETFKIVSDQTQKLSVINKFEAFSVAMDYVSRRKNGAGRPKNGYYLLRLDLKQQTVKIIAYSKDEASKAAKDYEKLEKLADNNSDLDAVLVSAGPLDELKKAYPNYFGDVSEFMKNLRYVKSQISDK